MPKWFLEKGNGHQLANRRKAMRFAAEHLNGLEIVDDQTVKLEPYGICKFSAFTDNLGAMISSPNKDDKEFGDVAWHARDHMMLFRDYGDGRVAIFLCPIKPLFAKRTIGHHGVRWEHLLPLSQMTKVFRV